MCISNSQNCSVENGSGISLWLGNQWSYQCHVTTCESGYHLEDNNCIASSRTCSLADGVGTQVWENGWQECVVSSCNAGFHNEYGECKSDVKPYPGLLAEGASLMALRFKASQSTINSPVYEPEIISCNGGFLLTNNQCQPLNTPGAGSSFVTGDVSCSGDKIKVGVFTEPQTNTIKTICHDMNTPVLYTFKQGNVDCSPSEVKVTYDGQTDVTKCQAKICQANYERKQYNMYWDSETNQIVYKPQDTDGQGSGTNLMGVSERVCTANGLSFGPQEVVKCNDSNQYYLNQNISMCEKYDSIITDNSDYKVYQLLATQKLYLQLKNKVKKFSSIKQRTAGDNYCSSYAWNSNNFFMALECSYVLGRMIDHDNDSGTAMIDTSSIPTVLSDFTSNIVSHTSGSYISGSDSTGSWVNRPQIALYQPAVQFATDSRGSYFNFTFSFQSTPSSKALYDCNTNYRQFKTDFYDINNILQTGKTSCLPSSYHCDPTGAVKFVTLPNNTAQVFSCTQNGTENGFNKYSFLPTENTTICLGNTHLNNNSCEPNVIECSSINNDIIPLNSFKSYKYWQTNNQYTICLISSCNSGYTKILEGDNYICANSQTFQYGENGSGGSCTITWNSTTGWTTCSPENNNITCNSGYHIENNACYSNTRIQTIPNGEYVCSWNSASQEYDSCTYNCINGSSQLNNTCVENISLSVSPNIFVVTHNNEVTINVSGTGNNYNFSINPASNQNISAASSIVKINNTTAKYKAGLFNIVGSNESDSALDTITVTDANNPAFSKTLTFTLHSLGKLCSPNLPNASQTYKKWLGTAYGDCNNIKNCNSSYLKGTENGLDKCFINYKSCTVSAQEDPNIKTSELNNGQQKWISSQNAYSDCYSSVCKNNENNISFFPYPYTDTNRKCQPSPFTGNQAVVEAKGQIYNNNGVYISFRTGISTDINGTPIDNWTPFYLKECSNNTYMTKDGVDNLGYTKATCKPYPIPACSQGFDRVSSSDCQDNSKEIEIDLKNRITEIGLNHIEYYDPDYTFYQFSHSDFPNAKCYNQQQGGFLYRKGYGSGKNRWIIMLQGGGACGTIVSKEVNNPQIVNICEGVSPDLLEPGFINGSKISQNSFNNSNNITGNPAIDLGILNDITNYISFNENTNDFSFITNSRQSSVGKVGILSNDQYVNKDFKSWNHILIRYCSQDLWTGKGHSINKKHNGRYILEATLDVLKKKPMGSQTFPKLPSLDLAQNIIVSGYSAGGEGIWYNGDYIKQEINHLGLNLTNADKEKRLVFLVDSGWINDYNGPWGDSVNYNSFEELFNYNLINEWIGAEPAKSVFGSQTIQLQPTFVIQDAFDHEFLNYNARNINRFIQTSNLVSNTVKNSFNNYGGLLKESYICNALNLNKIENEWNSNSFSYLSNYLLNDLELDNNEWVIKIFENYNGLYFSKGRHGFSTSNDWHTLKINNKSIAENFSQWYFLGLETKISEINKGNIDNLDYYLQGQTMCGSLSPNTDYIFNNLYLEYNFLNR